MADLRTTFAGIKSPNPFWLASAPPANSGAQVQRAFDHARHSRRPRIADRQEQVFEGVTMQGIRGEKVMGN